MPARWTSLPTTRNCWSTRFVGTESEAPLWIVPLPAGSPRRLADITGHDGAFSPDGRQLLFANGRSLFWPKQMAADLASCWTAAGVPFSARFSPDGTRIRFSLGDPQQNASTLWEAKRRRHRAARACFPTGLIGARSLTDSGRPTALTTSSPTQRAPPQISGRCRRGAAFSTRARRRRFSSPPAR